MQTETDAVVRSLADMLSQLGCDSGWLVPNTALSSKNINNAISSYQAKLDSMELEITKALQIARAKEPQEEPVPEPAPELGTDSNVVDIDLSGENNLDGVQNDVNGNDVAIDLTNSADDGSGNLNGLNGLNGPSQDAFNFQNFDPSQNNLGDEYDFASMAGPGQDNFGIYDDLSSGSNKLDDSYGLLNDQF